MERRAGDRLVFVFEANGFLRHMVRNMVGTLAEVGRGKRTPDELVTILAGRDRRLAGMTAPAHGLYLMAVNYGDGRENGSQTKTTRGEE